MDKDVSAELNDRRSSSDESVEVDEITFEDLIRGDDDEMRESEASSNKYSDPLLLKLNAETHLGVDKEDNRGSSAYVASKKLIVGSTTTNNNVIKNKLVSTSSSPSFVKIAPRSNTSSTQSPTTTTTTATTANGKIIYLKRPDGTSVPVRVPGQVTTNAPTSKNPAKSTVQIHVFRARDGSLVPVKSTKSINIPNVSPLAGKKIITTSNSGQSGQMLIKATTTPGASTATSTTATGSTIKPSMEAAKPKVRQVIASPSVLASNGSGKMMMQSSTGTKQLVVSSQNVQSMIKLSPNTSGGQLQAIQIPGKSGLQYVRVLNNTSGITHKISTSDSPTTPKYTLLRQTKPPMKVMVKSPVNDRDRQKMMTTIPTYRKINDVVVKMNDSSEGTLTQTQKISQINSQIRGFSTSGETRSATPSGSKYIVVSKSSLVHNTVTSQNQKVTQLRHVVNESQKSGSDAGLKSSPPPKMLYSVLRPTTEQREEVKDNRKEVKLEPWSDQATFKLTGATSSATARLPRPLPAPPADDGVTIRRKHCNCTKSMCLKLYCDCFANGEFCQDCNCKDCLNNLDNEDERQKAIRICLERNPNSFKPKITALSESDLRLHNKGCNCKRSGCLKNYCECYEAKIPCSSNCKCVGCRNVDDHPDLDMDVKKCFIPKIETHTRLKRSSDEIIKPRSSTLQPSTSSSASTSIAAAVAASNAPTACGPPGEKQPCNFITQEVVDATVQCLIAQADECLKSTLTPYQTERMVLEELGRCLVEIIDFSIRNTDQN